MKILILGSYGQLGHELMALAKSFSFDAIGFDHDSLDITNQEAVKNIITQQKPRVIINAAAYTAVDKAEGDAEAAYAVNADAVAYLAQSCKEAKILLVHVSTDYVFDGSKNDSYVEKDPANPLGVYGKSKFLGEENIRTICEQYYILRTSWVFSSHRNNFVKTMLRLGLERDELGIVSDQTGKPTSAKEIARTIYKMLESGREAWGTYHIAQPDSTTWFSFAKVIFEEAREQGMPLKVTTLNKLTTSDYPTSAKRPFNSKLSCMKLESEFKFKIKPWTESLTEVIKDLKDA